jgi:hypothetical protein
MCARLARQLDEERLSAHQARLDAQQACQDLVKARDEINALEASLAEVRLQGASEINLLQDKVHCHSISLFS